MEAVDLIDGIDAVDDDLGVSGDEAESGDDEKRHENLLKSFGVAEKPQKENSSWKDQRSEATDDVSIFSLAGSRGLKIEPQDLVKGLKVSVNVNKLKKNLTRVQKSSKHLKTPLPRITAEKTARDAAYEMTTTKVSRWDDVVKRNRRAEHLAFPLNHGNLQIHKVDDFVKRFKPKTPLEQQIYAVLKGNKYEERPENDLSVAEEEALKSMSIEEAQRRRAELQKHRALLSYHEAKNRRLGKIKSRRHLRIIRKQKERKSVAEFEDLQKKDPEGAESKLKQAEKLRAEERAVLRHRQGSKWAKNRMLMAKYNEMTKVQIQEQKKLHSELTRKSLTKIESSEDESEDENNNKAAEAEESVPLVPPTATMQTLFLPKNNPWLRQDIGSKKDDNGDSHEKAEEDVEVDEVKPNKRIHTRNQNALLGLESVAQKKEVDSESDSPEEDELQGELLEIRKRRRLRQEMENGSDSDANEGEIQTESINSFKAALTDLLKQDENRTKTGKKTENSETVLDGSEEDGDTDEEGLDLSTDRRQTLDDLERVLQTEDDISTLTDLHRSSKRKSESKKETKTVENIDPNKVFTLPTKTVTSELPKMVENEDENVSDGEGRADRMTIMEAFADDDVVADFMAEKKKNVSDSKPKMQDLTLPGWGEWGGIGLKPAKRKRRRFFVKPPPPPPRKDQHLGAVIINEKRDVHIAKHQVNQIPFPYTNDGQFERSIRQPIGPIWNTPSAFKKLTEPKVSTIAGAIIQPMDEEDAFDNTKPGQRKRVAHGDGSIGFAEVVQRTGPIKRRKRGNKKHKK